MILYTKKVCPKCKMVKKELEIRGISYDAVNIDEVIAEKEKLVERGIQKLPVMLHNGEYVTELSQIMEMIREEGEE